MKYLVGVVVLREQQAVVCVGVEAPTREEAERRAEADVDRRIRTRDIEAQVVLSGLCWDAAGDERTCGVEPEVSEENGYRADWDAVAGGAA